jgi:hypothetical protein
MKQRCLIGLRFASGLRQTRYKNGLVISSRSLGPTVVHKTTHVIRHTTSLLTLYVSAKARVFTNKYIPKSHLNLICNKPPASKSTVINIIFKEAISYRPRPVHYMIGTYRVLRRHPGNVKEGQQTGPAPATIWKMPDNTETLRVPHVIVVTSGFNMAADMMTGVHN